MSRPWRIEYAGAMYHVMSRGNEGRHIFLDDNDRERFIFLLKEMIDRFQIEIHAWVLMTNHYHLLLQTKQANLSKSMQWFGITYTRYFNIRHKRRGHLFQGRFKSLLVENDRYMQQLSCYIHRNPLRSGIIKRLADYRWSSYLRYAYGDDKHDWIVTEMILSQFSTKDKHKAYREVVQEYSHEKNLHKEDIRFGLVFGSKAFASSIKAKFKPDTPEPEIPTQKRSRQEFELESLLHKAEKMLGCDLKNYQAARRIRSKDILKRDALLLLLWSTGVLTNQEIGDILGISYSAVSRRVGVAQEGLKTNGEFQRLFDQIKSLIKM